MTLEQLKYPIGKYTTPKEITKEILKGYIQIISTFPNRLKREVLELSNKQLDTEYRPNGWTIRQVVNHCADSHMNCLTRFKLALTETNPTIKPYFEERWAELADSKTMPIEPALKIIDGIHERWTVILNNLTETDLKRTFVHPENGKQFQLDENIGLYAWHCNHHLAHITTLKKINGWN